MPYVILKKNGSRFKGSFVLTSEDADHLERNAGGDCYVLLNTTTMRQRKIGGCKRRRRGR